MGAEIINAAEVTPPVVETEDGPVTAAPLDYLERLCDQAQARLQETAVKITDLETETAELEATAGRTLTARPSELFSADRMPRIEAARGLERLVSTLEGTMAQIVSRPHHGVGGLIQGLKDKREAGDVQSKLVSAKAELDIRYRAVADSIRPPTGIGDVDALLNQVDLRRSQVEDLKADSQKVSAEHMRLSEELGKRKEVVAKLGFDALGAQADLSANGLRPISVNLVLKPKEIAVASAPSTLCRHKTRTQYVGGSQGLSIPLGHGFRYRVSSFRGNPVQTDFLATVDEGSLVVTNQRLVFLGSKRDVSVAIAKLLQVEPFSNGIGISREGKETRDIFLLSRPAYILLYLQWVVSHQT